MKAMRKSGILLPVTSLPSPNGIGCFSKEAYEWIDFLKEAGQTYWQVLPLGPTGYGDSPYQSFSTFAGNPYFLDLQEFVDRGWLKKREVSSTDFGADPMYVDYGQIYKVRFRLLKKAYDRSPLALPQAGVAGAAKAAKTAEAKAAKAGKAAEAAKAAEAENAALLKEFEAFIAKNTAWLPDYALYSAIKHKQGGRSYIEWPEKLRRRDEKELDKQREKLADEIRFYEFQQFFFSRQWLALKAYANENGIDIIGDVPIYVAFDSADTWASPELFQLDEKGFPTAVAGCPPDAFSATGQLWGNPLYRWDYHKQTGYSWWMRRLRNCFTWYDVLRIDHFRGFDEYYSIPFGDSTAEFGHWEKGPGYDFIGAVKKELKDCRIIAEDLGFLTPSVLRLLKRSGFPGMKVLQFAFDSREESDYLPHNYGTNCVVYTGTHDNETMRGWCKLVSRGDYGFAKRYLGYVPPKTPEVAFIRSAMASVADTCVIPIQDYLGLGHEARINTPSTLGDNWMWRLQPGQLTPELAEEIRRMTKLYGRL